MLRSDRRRPSVLYFIVRYPNFSETYMHEEIRSLSRDYEIKIITYSASRYPRREPFPYELIEYNDTCLVYGPFEKVNVDFQNPAQQTFLQKVGRVIEEFSPDVMHAHYFGMGLLLQKLAEQYHIPFTIRTHSMDVLSEPPQKVQTLCQAANSPWSLAVLTFPAFRNRLIASGLNSAKVVSCWPVIPFARFFRPEKRKLTGRVMCAGPAIHKKAHSDFIELARMMDGSGLSFDLYIRGHREESIRSQNERAGNVLRITYADPDDMQEVYPQYDWFVYTSDAGINKVGLPVSLAEAQAAGLGVCWQELPGRREEQLEFLGNAGFLFRSIDEVPALLLHPYPEEMRVRGLENARKCDIEQHRGLLTSAWTNAIHK